MSGYPDIYFRSALTIFCCAIVGLMSGCKKTSGAHARSNHANAKIDVCQLLSAEEIKAVQGSEVTGAKPSSQSSEGMLMSQCFYSAAETNRSVSLALTQIDPKSPGKTSPKEFWDRTFGPYRSGKKPEKEEHAAGEPREEEVENNPPKKIDGVGDEGFWSGTRVGGALYVLKDDVFIRISVGGADTHEAKIEKSKALAIKALQRL